MKVKNLLKVYEEQLENLNELKEAALYKQRSVIGNKRELLEKFTAREESVMNLIKYKETERENIFRTMFDGFELSGSSSAEISELLQQVSDNEEMSALDNLRSKIKSVSEEIKGINIQNRFLIEQANSIVKQTLGMVLKLQKKPIVDRRI